MCDCKYVYDENKKTFVCEKCGYVITDEDKQEALDRGNFLLKLDEWMREQGCNEDRINTVLRVLANKV